MAALTTSNGNGNGNHSHCFPPPQKVAETPDICDANSPLLSTGELRVLLPLFQPYGKRRAFSGTVVTVKTFEDNGVVVETLLGSKAPRGKVLVIDAGGSLRRSMVGSVLAAMAHKLGWAGLLVNGCIRDIDEINAMDIGVRALGSVPVRSSKKGGGERHVTVQFAGALIRDGDWLCADGTGIIVAGRELSVLGPAYEPVFHGELYTHVVADYTSPVEPHRLFRAHCLDDHTFLPEYLPEHFQSIHLLRGDSTHVGCIKQVNFAKGKCFKYVKNRVDELDPENLYMKYTSIEGDMLGDKWDHIVYEIEVKPSITGSHFKMTGNYYPKQGAFTTQEDLRVFREGLKNIHKRIQESLLLYPRLYA